MSEDDKCKGLRTCHSARRLGNSSTLQSGKWEL